MELSTAGSRKITDIQMWRGDKELPESVRMINGRHVEGWTQDINKGREGEFLHLIYTMN